MVGGFVALATLTIGLIRDIKRDTRRQLDEFREAHREQRAEFREAHAQTNQRIDDLRDEFREAHREQRTEFREAHREQRTEFREAHAQTNQRIDDLRATLVAILPRAAAEPVDAPPVRGARDATAAASAPKR